jgi:hypothetical protein
MMDKKKDSIGHQERVNRGMEAYVKTETPGKSIGAQASMDTIAMDNKSIEKLNKAKATKSAIGSIASMVGKRML